MTAQAAFQWIMAFGIVLTGIRGIGSYLTGEKAAAQKEWQIKDDMNESFIKIIAEIQAIPKSQERERRLSEIRKEISEKTQLMQINRQRKAMGAPPLKKLPK